MTNVRVDFPFLMEDRDRHGNVRVYVRRGGIKIRIREPKGSPGFARAYAEAVYVLNHPVGTKSRPAIEHASAGTLGWLAAKYFDSPRFGALDPKSQTTRRLVIEHCLREPRAPGSKSLMSACPLEYVNAGVVMMFMERKAGKPGAANNRKKYLSAMFGWAVKKRYMTANRRATPSARTTRPMDSTHGRSMKSGNSRNGTPSGRRRGWHWLCYCSRARDAATW